MLKYSGFKCSGFKCSGVTSSEDQYRAKAQGDHLKSSLVSHLIHLSSLRSRGEFSSRLSTRWLSVSALIFISLGACSPNSSEPPPTPTPKALERSSGDAEPNATPLPNAYTSNTSALLGQLYGGAIATPKSLRDQLARSSDLTLATPIPRAWRRAIKNLKRAQRVKVSRWSYQTLAHMDPKRRDETIAVTLQVWGKRDAVNRAILKTLRAFKALDDASVIPKRWGEGYELNITQGPRQLYVERSAELASDDPKNPTTLSTFKVIGSVTYPPPSGATRDCRLVTPLPREVGANFPKWAQPQLKSHGSRRFIGWYEEREGGVSSQRATWLYKSGAVHDRSIAWWTKRLEARGARAQVRDAMLEVGIEQTWTLPHSKPNTSGRSSTLKDLRPQADSIEIRWWPETRLGIDGCSVKGPALNLSLSTRSASKSTP